MKTTLLVSLSLLGVSSAMKTHFVYWNTTNPEFLPSASEHVVDVNKDNLPWEYDQLHLICPRNTEEQHVIYSVSEQEFRSCRVTNPRPKIVAICNKPGSFMYFTITFRSFSPTPGGMEFKPGQDYYFISTSTRRDLHRRVGGFCSSHNMKMKFRVADNTVKDQVENNLVQINLNEPRRPSGVPSVWGSRAPQYRSDYIYYYKPWPQHRQSKQASRFAESGSNHVLTALPLTSSQTSLSSLAGLVLAAVLVSKSL